jgi:hypothetical protein
LFPSPAFGARGRQAIGATLLRPRGPLHLHAVGHAWNLPSKKEEGQKSRGLWREKKYAHHTHVRLLPRTAPIEQLLTTRLTQETNGMGQAAPVKRSSSRASSPNPNPAPVQCRPPPRETFAPPEDLDCHSALRIAARKLSRCSIYDAGGQSKSDFLGPCPLSSGKRRQRGERLRRRCVSSGRARM